MTPEPSEPLIARPERLLDRRPLGRRRLLTMGGIAAMAIAAPLAACSAPSGQPALPGTPSGSGAGEPSVSKSTAQEAVTVNTTDVPVGGGYIMDDAPYLVTQPTPGEYKAFTKICPHQGCPVGEIKDQSIRCFCHGSEFSITDGSVLQGPANSPLPEVDASVAGDTITVG